MNKPNLHNFGATKIYVISDPKNVRRRELFKEHWNHFTGFDYEFVDAIMGDSLNIPELIDKGILCEFFCGEGGVSKNVIACHLSHRKAWQKAKDSSLENDDYVLFLEDDARLTPHFLDQAYFNGDYYKILERLKNSTVDLFWWGRADKKIYGTQVTDLLKTPEPLIGVAGHAYMMPVNRTDYYLQDTSLAFPVDVTLNSKGVDQAKIYSPNFSYLMQVQHINDQRFLPIGHPNKIWASTTQPWSGYSDRVYKEEYENVNPDIREFIKSAEYHYLDNGKQGILFKFNNNSTKPLI